MLIDKQHQIHMDKIVNIQASIAFKNEQKFRFGCGVS